MELDYQGRDPGRTKLWIAIGVMAVLLTVLISLLLSEERPQGLVQLPAASSVSLAPKPQPAESAPIVVAGQGGGGCETDPSTYDMTVIAVGERISAGASDQPIYLQDSERLVRKYYIDLSGVPDAEKPRLSNILSVGQQLKVRYVLCGSGGFRFLTFMQPMAAG
jgi:hypothetical protein